MNVIVMSLRNIGCKETGGNYIMAKNFYALKSKTFTGVLDDWALVEPHTVKGNDAKYAGFDTEEDAKNYLELLKNQKVHDPSTVEREGVVYAVRDGEQGDKTYKTWAEAKKNIISGTTYRKFEADTQEKLDAMVKEYFESDTVKRGISKENKIYAVHNGKEGNQIYEGKVDGKSAEDRAMDAATGHPKARIKSFRQDQRDEALAFANQEAKGTFYAVRRGHETGIVENWVQCEEMTLKYPGGAIFEKFNLRSKAEEFMAKPIEQILAERAAKQEGLTEADIADIPAPTKEQGTEMTR